MGANTSSAKNVTDITSESVMDESTSISQNADSSVTQAMQANIIAVNGDAVFAGNNMNQTATVSLSAVLDAMTTSDAQNEMAATAEQNAKAINSGLQVGNTAKTTNKVNSYMSSSINISNSIAQNCKSVVDQTMTYNVQASGSGNAMMLNNVVAQNTSVLEDCTQDTVAESSAVNSMSTTVAQTATSTNKGLSPTMIVVIIICLCVAVCFAMGCFSYIVGKGADVVTIGGGGSGGGGGGVSMTKTLTMIIMVFFMITILFAGLSITWYYKIDRPASGDLVKPTMQVASFSKLFETMPNCGMGDPYTPTLDTNPKNGNEASVACAKDDNCMGFDFKAYEINRDGDINSSPYNWIYITNPDTGKFAPETTFYKKYTNCTADRMKKALKLTCTPFVVDNNKYPEKSGDECKECGSDNKKDNCSDIFTEFDDTNLFSPPTFIYLNKDYTLKSGDNDDPTNKNAVNSSDPKKPPPKPKQGQGTVALNPYRGEIFIYSLENNNNSAGIGCVNDIPAFDAGITDGELCDPPVWNPVQLSNQSTRVMVNDKKGPVFWYSDIKPTSNEGGINYRIMPSAKGSPDAPSSFNNANLPNYYIIDEAYFTTQGTADNEYQDGNDYDEKILYVIYPSGGNMLLFRNTTAVYTQSTITGTFSALAEDGSTIVVESNGFSSYVPLVQNTSGLKYLNFNPCTVFTYNVLLQCLIISAGFLVICFIIVGIMNSK